MKKDFVFCTVIVSQGFKRSISSSMCIPWFLFVLNEFENIYSWLQKTIVRVFEKLTLESKFGKARLTALLGNALYLTKY